MLEAKAHQQLKALLQREGGQRWPHHLSLSRLVARGLRRGDHTLVRLAHGTDPSWWISLLVPLALSPTPLALVVSDERRERLLQQEWPRLRAAGLNLACWEGLEPAPATGLWLLNHRELLQVWRLGHLVGRRLVIPEAELLDSALRDAMAVVIHPSDWDQLRRALPSVESSLLELHQRLTRRIFSHRLHGQQRVPMAAEDEAPLRHLLALAPSLPPPWPQWLAAQGPGWCGWADADPARLHWRLHCQPLEPLQELSELVLVNGTVLVGELASGRISAELPAPVSGLGLEPRVVVELADPPLAEPLPLYAPIRQPLPNTPHFADHLLDHSRRLVLGQRGLTIVLIDDVGLRLGLASGLAADFGSRVAHEVSVPDANGVLCCSWNWWLEHQGRLPLPGQVVIGMLPIASLEDPLTAARVAALRQVGRDWFRELLLPEALNRLQRGLAGLRRGGSRVAILDGRLRGRSWGRQVFMALEPWVQLARLLPSNDGQEQDQAT